MLSRIVGGEASYSSVRRAAQGEGEQEQSIVIAIAGAVMNDEDLRSFLRTYYPQLERAVSDIKRPDKTESTDNKAAIIDFLKSDHHAKILLLADSLTGTTDDEVVRKWGEQSLKYFNDIKDSGILSFKNDAWFLEESVSNISQSLARQLICSLAKEFDPRNDSIRNASFSYLLWESLNKDGLRKLAEADEKHAKEVYDIASNPANQGDILVIFGLLHNVLKGSEGLS